MRKAYVTDDNENPELHWGKKCSSDERVNLKKLFVIVFNEKIKCYCDCDKIISWYILFTDLTSTLNTDTSSDNQVYIQLQDKRRNRGHGTTFMFLASSVWRALMRCFTICFNCMCVCNKYARLVLFWNNIYITLFLSKWCVHFFSLRSVTDRGFPTMIFSYSF